MLHNTLYQCSKCRKFLKRSECILDDGPWTLFGPELLCPHCEGLMMWRYHPILSLILPVCLAVAANETGYLPFKMGVPLLCAALLIAVFRGKLCRRADVWYVIAAFVFSAIGDYFLSNKRGNESYFVIGIATFFVAHLGYLGFSLLNGRLHRVTLGVLLAGYVPYFAFVLRPAIADPVLFGAVLLYLLVSCVGLAAATGLRLGPAEKWLYVFGILMIVVSDTFISFNEFLKYRTFNEWILPTYYLAHIMVTASVLTTTAFSRAPGGSLLPSATSS